MPLTKKQKAKVIERARQTGKWFLRRSDAGSSHEGFQWSPVGEWTEAPDWNESDRCGGGLHGNDSETTDCWWSDGNDLDFCVYDGPMVRIGGKGGKIKIRRAMVVLRNEFPPWLTEWSGSLDLENTGITYLGYLQSVGGWLDLRGTGIKPKSVKSDLKDKCLFLSAIGAEGSVMDEAEIQQAVADYANAVGCSVSVDIDYWTHIHPFSTKSHTEYSLWVSSTNCRYKYKSIDELVQSVRQKTILMKKF